jgi:CheY-like chemotaxis protein
MSQERDGKRRILVVEDDALVSAMMQDALEYAGFEVTAVQAGEDALSLMAMDVPFDLLMTDIDLAGPMNGWELAEDVREMRGDIPIIYASAHVEAGGSTRVGNSLFLSKPYSPVAVCALIRELLTPSVYTPDIAPAMRPAAVVVDLAERRALRA